MRSRCKAISTRWIACAACLLSISLGPAKAFDLQGHRGARGLAPENTIAGFRKALEIGVTTLETDLAVTRDRKIVLSHDTVLNPDLTRDSSGVWLRSPSSAIRSLDLETLRRLDVGRLRPESRYADQWPHQRPSDGERMPTLDELLRLAKGWRTPVRLNIETKLSPHKPTEAPEPEDFARLVVEAVRRSGMSDRVTIQSFDWRTLIASRRLAPEIATSCLTVDSANWSTLRAEGGRPSPWLGGIDPGHYGGSAPRAAKAAGCAVWAAHWRNVTAANVTESHALGLKVIPWTVNDTVDMARLIDLKVDGLITDYPDRARTVMAAKGLPLP